MSSEIIFREIRGEIKNIVVRYEQIHKLFSVENSIAQITGEVNDGRTYAENFSKTVKVGLKRPLSCSKMLVKVERPQYFVFGGKKNMDYQTPFQTIERAATVTGLSRYFLRTGCRAGTVPHVKIGKKYFINIPALMEQMNAASKEAVRDNG